MSDYLGRVVLTVVPVCSILLSWVGWDGYPCKTSSKIQGNIGTDWIDKLAKVSFLFRGVSQSEYAITDSDQEPRILL